MKAIQNMKFAQAIYPQSLNNGTATAVEVDATGANHATFVFPVGASAGNISVSKVQYATTSGGSLTDVPSGAITADTIDSDADNTIHVVHVDLSDKSIGNFLKVTLTEDNTGAVLIGCLCILSELNDGPTSASERGLTTEVYA